MFVEENKPLAPFTTFGIGGPARWFVQAETEEDVAEAASWARERSVPLFVLGGGSNLLVADSGFDGLVLHVAIRGMEVREQADGHVVFEVGAGEDWEHFVQKSAEADCAGVECLAGIPGTVGGTPVQNVGAYGQEVASSIVRVRAFDLQNSTFVEFTNEECGFAYRRSRFNSQDRGRYIVTRVDYRLMRGGSPTLRYVDLQKAFPDGTHPTLVEAADVVRRVRQSKGMLMVEGDSDCHSAGSFFKNPVVDDKRLKHVAAALGKEPPRFPAGNDAASTGLMKIPAAWLIEQAGFPKGYTFGAAGVSSKHTLALVNRGGATAADILALAEKIQATVDELFGIRLEREPVLLGF